MKTSTHRILTTHVGSIPRPAVIQEMLRTRLRGEPVDEAEFDAQVRGAVAQVVRQQAAAGIDVVTDGELSKASFIAYANERLTGCERVEQPPSADARQLTRREWMAYPEYYAEYLKTQMPAGANVPIECRGPLSYKGQQLVQRDIANLKAALEGVEVEEAFVPAIAPGTFARGANRYYKTDEEFRFAIAEALKPEYEAIINAGFVLQIDDPGLAETWDMFVPAISVEEYRKLIAIQVEALNHALRDIPEDRVRYHICWGSWQGPHTADIPLKEVVDIMLQVRAQAYSVEAANPRHAYEWRVWEDVKLPDDKILIPGVIAHTTAVVEHPETVAERLMNFARLVGRERVIAGADCGFAQGAFYARQHPTIMWAKFQALAEGARLATQRLWQK